MREGSAPSWLMERVSRFCLRHSDMNVVLGRCMEERILAKGIPPEQVRQIGVWSDQEAIQPIPRENNEYRAKWGVEDRLVVMYSGNFGLGHDVDTFLNAALALKDDDRIRFAFIGGGKKKGIVEAFISEHGLERNCILEPFQPCSKLDELLSAGDVHLISLLDGIQGVMIPCKLFGILAVGRPALFIGNPASEVSRVIEENRCGRTITLGDSTELVEAITTYERDPGERRPRASGHDARSWTSIPWSTAAGPGSSCWSRWRTEPPASAPIAIFTYHPAMPPACTIIMTNREGAGQEELLPRVRKTVEDHGRLVGILEGGDAIPPRPNGSW